MSIKSYVKKINGNPEIFVGEKQISPSIFAAAIPKSDGIILPDNTLSAVAAAGVEIMQIHITATYYMHMENSSVWLDNETFDYSFVDFCFQRIVKALPDILLLPRVHIDPPPWWIKKHSEEMGFFLDKEGRKVSSKRFASTSSNIWRDAASTALRKLIVHIEKLYGKNVIGYHVCGGAAHEWFFDPDSSFPFTNGFQTFLREKYNDNISALSACWGTEMKSFEDANVPSPAEKEETDVFFFRDPQKRQNVIDYNIYWNQSIAEYAIGLAKTVKKAVNFNKITGIFFGYIPRACKIKAVETFGHLCVNKILDSKYIDFIASPTDYDGRSIGGGTKHWIGGESVGGGATLAQGVPESVRLHGKVWIDENDHRTHLSPDRNYGATPDIETTIQMQRRAYSFNIAHGMAHWWYDMAGNWFHDKRLISEMKSLVEIGRLAHHCNMSSISEVVVVVDNKSFYNTGNNKAIEFYKKNINLSRFIFANIGTPVDYLLLSDIASAPKYKFYIFLNAFELNDSDIAMLNNSIFDGNVHVMWLYAPGYIYNGTLNLDCVESLAGTPVFIKDGNIRLKNGAKTMLSKHEKIMSYLTMEMPRADELVPILKNAGVHFYLDALDQTFHANKSFLTLHAWSDGKRTIHLSEKLSVVYDVFNDVELKPESQELKTDLSNGETGLYFLGTQKKFLENSRCRAISRSQQNINAEFSSPAIDILNSIFHDLNKALETIKQFAWDGLFATIRPDIATFEQHLTEIDSLIASGDTFTAFSLLNNFKALQLKGWRMHLDKIQSFTPRHTWRINCGGKAIAEGNWLGGSGEEDSYVALSKISSDTNIRCCNVAQKELVELKNAQPPLFGDFVNSNAVYIFPVVSGTYSVKVYLMEQWYSNPNRRHFSIALNGTDWLQNFDVFAQSGRRYKPITYTGNCKVNDFIVLEFKGESDVFGIEIKKLSNKK